MSLFVYNAPIPSSSLLHLVLNLSFVVAVAKSSDLIMDLLERIQSRSRPAASEVAFGFVLLVRSTGYGGPRDY